MTRSANQLRVTRRSEWCRGTAVQQPGRLCRSRHSNVEIEAERTETWDIWRDTCQNRICAVLRSRQICFVQYFQFGARGRHGASNWGSSVALCFNRLAGRDFRAVDLQVAPFVDLRQGPEVSMCNLHPLAANMVEKRLSHVAHQADDPEPKHGNPCPPARPSRTTSGPRSGQPPTGATPPPSRLPLRPPY